MQLFLRSCWTTLEEQQRSPVRVPDPFVVTTYDGLENILLKRTMDNTRELCVLGITSSGFKSQGSIGSCSLPKSKSPEARDSW